MDSPPFRNTWLLCIFQSFSELWFCKTSIRMVVSIGFPLTRWSGCRASLLNVTGSLGGILYSSTCVALLRSHSGSQSMSHTRYWPLKCFNRCPLMIINFTEVRERDGFFKCPQTFKWVAIAKKQSHKLLEAKMAHLGLVIICDKWNYNPFNDLGNEFIKVTQNP